MSQYQISSEPRNIRSLYLIDTESCTYNKLMEIILENQEFWGGRYNPIIPVTKNVIEIKYIKLIRFFDPDYICYTQGIAIEELKFEDEGKIYYLGKSNIINPLEYIPEYKRQEKRKIAGISIRHFIETYYKDHILVSLPSNEKDHVLYSFYTLNLGLRDYRLYPHITKSSVGVTKLSDIDDLIHKGELFIPSHLCESYIDKTILQRNDGNYNDRYRLIVIGKDKTSLDDLLYYWNVRYFEIHKPLYLTYEQAIFLSSMPEGLELINYYFNTLVPFETKITSITLSQNELDDLTDRFNKLLPPDTYSWISFVNEKITNFPDNWSLYTISPGPLSFTKNDKIDQTAYSNTFTLNIKPLSFIASYAGLNNNYIITLKLEEQTNSSTHAIKYPFSINTSFINQKARINSKKDINIVIDAFKVPSKESITIKLPSQEELFKRLILTPVINSKFLYTKISHCSPHSPGRKLNAFLNLFNDDLKEVEEMLSDDMWFEVLKQLSTSSKSCGDIITIREFENLIRKTIRDNNMSLLKDEQKEKIKEMKNKLEELCKKSIFLIGYKIKCPHCSSDFWYPLNEVNEIIKCRGCINSYSFPNKCRNIS